MIIKQPGLWQGEAQPIGVFLGGEGDGDDGLRLLDIHSSETPRQALDRDLIARAGEGVCAFLDRVRAAIAAYREGDEHPRFGFDALDPGERRILGEILGEGEVSIGLGLDPRFEANESVLPGLWRVRVVEPDGTVTQEWLEIGDVPVVVRAGAQAMTRPQLVLPESAPEGAMNAMPVLGEIADRMNTQQPGTPNHVINFTLMPMTPVDTALIARVLGRAPFDSSSRGFGSCKVHLTGHRGVWGVQYFNGLGKVVLDTLEIGDVPVALLAAQDDYADSAMRLGEILEAYRT
jgi:hydrogenase-1 operon protein HyaF